jgi:hypothetical protein
MQLSNARVAHHRTNGRTSQHHRPGYGFEVANGGAQPAGSGLEHGGGTTCAPRQRTTRRSQRSVYRAGARLCRNALGPDRARLDQRAATSPSQAIQRSKLHRPPERRCWSASRAILWQAKGNGEKTPEGWAAAMIYSLPGGVGTGVARSRRGMRIIA